VDSVVTRPRRPMVRLPRLSGRRRSLLLVGLLLLALGILAAVREFTPHLVANSAPPFDVCGTPGVTVVNSKTVPTTWDAGNTWVIEASCTGGVTVPFGTTLTIDAAAGPVAVLTHGPGITVSGGLLQTKNTSSTNTVSFDLEGDATSWPGLVFTADSGNHQSVGNLSDTSISHAQNGISISGGAPTGHYGLTLNNVSILSSFFDGIQATETPISVTGGKVSDAGLIGIDSTQLVGAAGNGLLVTNATIGRTGAEGILESGAGRPVTITSSHINNAGTFGIHLQNSSSGAVQGNTISCSGRSNPLDCTALGTRYPAIYLDGGTLDLLAGVTGNTGSRNGLDAIAMHGTTTKNVSWLTPSDSATDDPTHALGYLIDGSLTVQGASFIVLASQVVKTAGALNISGGSLDASHGGATFTSLDDNGPAGVTQACPSVFVSSCPSPLGGREWGGISLVGTGSTASTAVFDGATVAHASTAIAINNNGVSFAPSTFALTVRNGSIVGPSASDGIAAIDTPVSVDNSTITGIGAHGISASFLGPAPVSAGLSITNSTVDGSGSEGILGTALTGQPITITKNLIRKAGSYGIRLEGAGQGTGLLTLKGSTVTGTGTGSSPYPAIYLNGVTADFTNNVTGNMGNGNGLDAIVFHGTALNNLSWQTAAVNPSPTSLLGYLLDSGLTLNGGTLTVHAGDVIKAARGGQITVNGNFAVDGSDVSSSNTKVFTSLKDTSAGVPICPVTVLSDCSSPKPGDWGGLNLTGGAGATITNGLLRFASTGIAVDHGSPVSLANTSIDSTSSDGIAGQSTSISITGGTFSNIGQHGINTALATPSTSLTVGGTHFNGSGNEAIFGTGLGGHLVSITNTTIDRAGFFGINVQNADWLTLQNNVVTNSGKASGGPFPAIYLSGVTGDFTAAISGNTGDSNGLDALAFHGTVTGDLSWITATQSAAIHPLGYLLDGGVGMNGAHTLTVPAGGIVKVSGGAINLNGGTLLADDTTTASGKVFTSLADNTAGMLACPSALLPACAGPMTKDWGGINLAADSGGPPTHHGNGSFVNATIRYATTGITISSGATASPDSSSYGLTVVRSRFSQTAGDAISGQNTPVLITNSSITSAGGRGINVDLLGDTSSVGLQVRDLQTSGTADEGVLGTSLTGKSVWISDSRIRNAGLYGIQLQNADHLVLRNNFVSGSGGGYSAIYLNGVTADLTHDVRGNMGASNGLDAIVFHGTVTQNLTWIDPTNSSAAHTLGYLLDGGMTMNGNLTLKVHSATVKAMGGGILLNGGTLDANAATFTSLADTTAGLNLCAASGSSPFVVCGKAPQAGDWAGISITNFESGHAGSATLVGGAIKYAATAIAIDTTNPAGLNAQGTVIAYSTSDGISTQDTPIALSSLNIHNIGGRGVVATYFGSATVGAVSISGSSFDTSGKEAILASVTTSQAISITGNTIKHAGTYAIQLVGASQPTVSGNDLELNGTSASSAMPPTHFPALYLNGVTGADFSAAIAGNHGFQNNLDAIAFHGAASGSLTWQTVKVNSLVTDPLGYLLDGPLAIGADFTVPGGSVVRAVGGAITVGGNLLAGGSGTKTFTSLLDSIAPAACPSPIIKLTGCTPAAGNWGGLTVNGAATLTMATISFDDGLTVTGGALQYTGGAMHDIAANAIVVANHSLSVTGVSLSKIVGDGIDATSSGSPNTITDDQFDHVGGVSINLLNAQGDLERNVFTNDGNPTIKASGAPVVIQCSSIQSGGLVGDTGLTVKESDFATGVGVTAPAGAKANDNWWGQISGPNAQLSGGVAVTRYFTAQKPTAAVVLADQPTVAQPLDPVRSDGSFGTGQLQARLTFSRNMNTAETTLPTVTYFQNSAPLVTVAVAGSWTGDRTWIGTALVSAAMSTNGPNTVSASGAHSCVPDPLLTLNNVMTPATQPFAVDVTGPTSLPVVAVSAADQLGAHSAQLHGHIDPNGWATGTGSAEQFVLTNILIPADKHTFPVPAVGSKTTPLDFALVATGLTPLSTYSYQLQVPSVNGTPTEPTVDSLTTTGPASKLVFTASPAASIVAGASFTAGATAEDAPGNVVSDFAGSVTVALSIPNGATLTGTLTQSVVLGVATFGDLSVNKTGTYTLTATSSPLLTPAISSSFTIQPGAATQLVFTVQPPATPTAGATLTPAIQVSVEDGLSNLVTGDSTTAVSVALTGSPAGVTLSGTLTRTASSGVATFGDLSVNKTGTYTLTATSSPLLTPATSSSFTIQPGAATQLVFTVQPPATPTAGVAMTPALHVSVEDSLNNVVTGDNATMVTVALTIPNGATLAGTTTQTAASGTASFATLSVNKTGTYTLTATSSPLLTPAISSSFTIQPSAATQLVFTVQPPATPTAGATLTPALQVSVEDSLNNVVAGDNTTAVSVALTGSPAGVTLSGTLTRTASSGVATFGDLSVNKTGTYTLTATSSPLLTPATSSSFTIQPGAATQLVFTTEPSPTASALTAFAQQPVVSLEDAGGNVVTTDNTTVVTLSLAGGAPSPTLTCTTNPVTVSSGVASFVGCSIDKASVIPYQVVANSTSPTLGPVSSTNVTVS
jgi:hypothetical protein